MMAESANTRIVEAQGLVKWFDPKKGYGFIVGPEGQDIFVHYSKIQGDGFRVLKDGSTVAYDAELTDRGWHASRVLRPESLEVSVPPRRNYTRSPRR
jgi:cold shock protein